MVKQIVILLSTFAILFSTNFSAAQQAEGKIPRIGYLSFYSAEDNKRFFTAFQQGLKDLGYVEGKNIVIKARYADGKRPRIHTRLAELLRLNPDIIVTGARGAYAAQKATSTIPIVLTYSADPVKAGLVASLARPGGNITGLSVIPMIVLYFEWFLELIHRQM